jgi:hypothetical protein
MEKGVILQMPALSHMLSLIRLMQHSQLLAATIVLQ